jgi:ABC-type glycerol-3-phosphate transport system substrate-binding protein
MRRLNFVLALVCAITGVSFGGASNEAAAEPIEIRAILFGGPQWYDWLDNMKTTFEEANPGYRVSQEYIATQEMRTKLAVDVAGGDPPAVASMDAPDVADFANLGQLESVSKWISKDELDMYYASAFEGITFDGEIFALPSALWVDSIIIREDLINEAGFDSGDIKTWSDLLDVARASTIDKDGDGTPDQWGGLPFNGKSAFEVWYRWVGVQYGNNFSPVDLGERTKWLEFLNFVKENSNYIPEASVGWDMTDGRTAFVNGSMVMYLGGTWEFGQIATMNAEMVDKPGTLSTVQNPLGPSGDDYWSFSGAHTYAMFETKNQEAAWAYLLHITQPEMVAPWAWNLGVPARKDISTDMMIDMTSRWLGKDAVGNSGWYKQLFEPFGPGLKPNTVVPNQAEFYDAYSLMLTEVALGSNTPEAALDQYLKTATSLLSGN